MLIPVVLAVLLLILPCLFSRTTKAGERTRGSYQEALLKQERKARGELVPDPQPAGKTIEKILIASHDVIGPEDPWPNLMNRFHTTTQTPVVSRELLFQEGDRWDDELVAETTRNLRRNLVVGIAEIQAVQGSAPDRVVALVVIKDLWSLRINQDFSVVGSSLEYFRMQLIEQNLGGKNRDIALGFDMDLASWTFTQNYVEPWLLGERIQLGESLSIILNRETGRAEGGAGSFSLQRPLYSLGTEWGWSVAASAQRDYFRLFSNGTPVRVESPLTGESLPYTYEQRRVGLLAQVTRSFGRKRKQDFSVGWRAALQDFAVPAPSVGVQNATLDYFRENYLPRTEKAGMIFLNYRFYRPDYIERVDFNMYSLTEDFRLGPLALLEARFASPAFGLDSSFIETLGSLEWNWDLGDNLLMTNIGASARYQPELKLKSAWVNRNLTLEVKNFSPVFGPVRLVTGARFVRRALDLDHTISVIGGDTTLRGYPSQFFSGANLIGINLEIRTQPWRTNLAHVGGVAFLDAGDAFDNPSSVHLHPSVGFGTRILLPQFNRNVLRLDFGFPLESTGGATPSYMTAKYKQAF